MISITGTWRQTTDDSAPPAGFTRPTDGGSSWWAQTAFNGTYRHGSFSRLSITSAFMPPDFASTAAATPASWKWSAQLEESLTYLLLYRIARAAGGFLRVIADNSRRRAGRYLSRPAPGCACNLADRPRRPAAGYLFALDHARAGHCGNFGWSFMIDTQRRH